MLHTQGREMHMTCSDTDHGLSDRHSNSRTSHTTHCRPGIRIREMGIRLQLMQKNFQHYYPLSCYSSILPCYPSLSLSPYPATLLSSLLPYLSTTSLSCYPPLTTLLLYSTTLLCYPTSHLHIYPTILPYFATLLQSCIAVHLLASEAPVLMDIWSPGKPESQGLCSPASLQL